MQHIRPLDNFGSLGFFGLLSPETPMPRYEIATLYSLPDQSASAKEDVNRIYSVPDLGCYIDEDLPAALIHVNREWREEDVESGEGFAVCVPVEEWREGVKAEGG